MTAKEFSNAFGNIGGGYVDEAATYAVRKKSTAWLKWGAVAAGFAVILAAAVYAPRLLDENGFVASINGDKEYFYEKGYSYRVDEDAFSSYVGGKVIAEEKLGERLCAVSVTAGWKNGLGEWTTTEKLRGELYSIKGVPKEVAVALRFADKGEAVTTTHYYVIMNPSADLTAVEEYIIVYEAHGGSENGTVME